MSNYYYLVSSLPELRLDDYKEPYRVNEFVEELYANLEPEHCKYVQDILWMNDNPNIIDIVSGSENTWLDAKGNWTFEEIKAFFANPESLDPKQNAYILGFINALGGFKKEDKKINRLQAENLLLTRFYAKMMNHENSFIKEYFTFDFQLRNVLLAINKRKFNQDEINLLEVGEDEVIQKLQKSTANDFNLSMDLEYLQGLLAAFEKDDILFREKLIDQLRWAKIDQINTFSYFKVDVLLGYLIKLIMVERWLAMGAARGQEAFLKISEIDSKLLKQ
ncbi:MAG: DUF2764 domain-containing protein [Candidatus Omnitrophica bacterium]|nr:DUF2764 domain-containing protein [Candidatus Omnitrophota bacterium]